MQSGSIRVAPVFRLAMATLVALALATPASAQFGLKKRLKAKAAEEGVSKATGSAEKNANAEAPAQGGSIVLTSDVVNQLLTGLKAGQAELEGAAREDTPYGSYQKAEAAYAVAQPKCQAAQASFPQRAAANQKLNDKYSALTQKMVDAMQKQDHKRAEIYQDSAMAMMDPSCVVKRPEQPKDYYEGERDAEVRAEKAEVKASGMSGGELAMVKERVTAILQGSTPSDASASEKAAVSAKSAELKPLLGFKEPTSARVMKSAPAAAPTPTPSSDAPAADPQAAATASQMGECMSKNIQAHQAEIEALGKRAQAAQKAQNQAALMAIADTVQRIQTAGCR
jgi:hypothetical protein